MGLGVSSFSLQPVDFSDSALGLLDGNVLNRYKAVINVYMSKYTQPKRLGLSGNTITNINGLDGESFLNLQYDGNPLLVGETIKIQGSALNTGTFTITGVTNTAVTVSGTFTTETIEVGCIYVTSAVTAFDFYYNLLGNNETLSFISKTDKNVLQKYTITGIACGTTSPTYLKIGTKSMAWVTDTLTGIVSTSTIAGGGAASGAGATYKQSFVITHYFSQAPYFLSNLSANFQSLLPPSWYSAGIAASGLISGGGLQYVANIGAKYLSTDSTPQNFAIINNQNGIACWLDQNPAGTNPDFTLTSISYVDNATSNVLTAIDFTKTNNVTIVIASASGAFTNSTVIDLNHLYCPLTATDYQNTSTTLLQNMMNDRMAMTVGGSAVNGLFYGTNYSVIQNAQAVKNSAYQITITFKAIFTSYLQTYLISRSGNRNYTLTVATEGATASTRTNILCDFNSYDYDQQNPSLLSLYDYIHFYSYPYIKGGDTNNISGKEGDKFVAQIPFNLLITPQSGITPLLQSVVMSVVATKAGEADFIVESQTINTSDSCSFNGKQTPSYSFTRGYQTYPGDPFNTISLNVAPQYDNRRNTAMKGYLLSYGLTLRYDAWNSIQPNTPGIGSNCGSDINNDIQNVNNSWANLSTNGWGLVVRVTFNVKGYDGYVTSFTANQAITVNPMGWMPDTGPSYAVTTSYYDANPTSATLGNQVPNIIPGSQTRVSVTYTPDGTSIPSNYSGYKGMLWVDLVGQGGVNGRRISSTEIDAEEGSPWSPAAKNGSPTTFYSNGISINIYSNGVVIVEGVYDDTVTGWGSIPNVQFITAGSMELVDSALRTTGGIDIATTGGRVIT